MLGPLGIHHRTLERLSVTLSCSVWRGKVLRTRLDLFVESSRKREIEGEMGGNERKGECDEGNEVLHAENDCWLKRRKW